MNRKDYLAVLFVAGLGGILGGGVSNYFISVSPVIAESQLLPWQKELLQGEEKRQTQRNKHLNSLDLIQAEGFILRDQEGKVRAVLATEPEGEPYLEMFNEDGHDIARLDPGFLFLNPKNDFYHSAGLRPLGLQIHNGEAAIDLSSGDPLEFKGGHRSPSIFLSGENGKIIWSAP